MTRWLASKITLIVVVVAALGYFLRNHFVTAETTPVVGQNLGVVETGDLIQRVTIAGTVFPQARSIITAPYPGYIQKIFVRIGDRVKMGDPIVSIAQSVATQDPTYPLRAPLTGTVVHVEKSAGEFVKEGDAKDLIVRIDDLRKLFVLASAPELDRVKMKAGQEATIKASAILDRSYHGIIRDVSLASQEKDRWERSQSEFPARLEITDPDENLRPGMSVIVDIITNKREQVLTLRHEYIHRDKEVYFVLLADGSRQDIEVGSQNEEVFEIRKGLKEGDRVRQVDFSTIGNRESL